MNKEDKKDGKENLEKQEKDDSNDVQMRPCKSAEKDRAYSQSDSPHHGHQTTSHYHHHHHNLRYQEHHHSQHEHHGQHGQHHKSLSKAKRNETSQPQAILLPHARAGQNRYSVNERTKYPKLNGADLYVVRIGRTEHVSQKKQPRKTLGEKEIESCSMSTIQDSMDLVERPSTGSLHDELRFPEPRVAHSEPKDGSKKFDCSMIRASRPCYRCIEHMHAVGIKRVFWTNERGQWEGQKVRELYDAFDNLTTDGIKDGVAGSGAFVTKHEVLMLHRTMGRSS